MHTPTLEIHLTAIMLKCSAASHSVGLMFNVFLAEAELIVRILYVLNQLNGVTFCVV